MTTKRRSSRRSFIAVAGAALSAPVAAAAAALPEHFEQPDPLQARLETLEDLNAIRELNEAYARHINAAAHEELARLFDDPAAARIDDRVRGLSAENGAADDVIAIAEDRQTASACLRRTVHTETAIGPSCTLVEMARLQGGGFVSSTDSCVIETVYVRRDGVWKFQRAVQRRA